MWTLLCGNMLRLLNIYSRSVTRGSGLSRSGPWLVWRRVRVPAMHLGLLWCVASQPTCHAAMFWGAFHRGFGGWKGHLPVDSKFPRHLGL
jgi:hypothetical protein